MLEPDINSPNVYTIILFLLIFSSFNKSIPKIKTIYIAKCDGSRNILLALPKLPLSFSILNSINPSAIGKPGIVPGIYIPISCSAIICKNRKKHAKIATFLYRLRAKLISK